MEREALINEISEYFGILKQIVVTRSKLNLQDINIHAEQFYCGVLNKVYGYQLENINVTDPNADTIDLGDKVKRIAIQVTSNDSKAKIVETVKAFNDKGLYKDYDVLKILVIKDKTPRKGVLTESNVTFDMENDVIDVNTIIRTISSKSDLTYIREVRTLLYDELASKYYTKRHTKPNEVNTFLRLITILSDDANHQIFKVEGDPDPEFKIEKRFAEYSTFLKSQYVDLTIDYGFALKVVEQNGDVSSVQIRKIGNFLKEVSSNYLMLSQNNPQEALQNLCEHFKSICEQDGTSYDEMAIKFYLIHQMIQCNVFPN